MKLLKTALPILTAVAAFAAPPGLKWSALAMPVSLGLSALWVLLSIYAVRRWSAYLPAFAASSPFAIFWPLLGSFAELSCRWGRDCL